MGPSENALVLWQPEEIVTAGQFGQQSDTMELPEAFCRVRQGWRKKTSETFLDGLSLEDKEQINYLLI